MVLLIILILLLLFFSIEYQCRRNKKTLLEHLHPEWFRDVTKFPEYAFPCRKNHTLYKNIIEKGFEKMKDTNIIFAGLCINIENKVPNLLKRLNHIGGFFNKYECVVFENDSSDNTRNLLENNNIHLVPCKENSQCKLKKASAVKSGTFSTDRMKKMTDYRNRLLEYINDNFSEYDCVCFLDLDLDGPIDIRGVAHSFGLYNTWDSISAHGLNGMTLTLGIPIYYDILAYKDDQYDINNSKLDLLPILLKTNSYKVGDFPYKVKSGFCGMAFYKMNVIKNIDYVPKDGNYTCEHVSFHKNMIDGGFDKIYINPNMLVIVGAQGDVEHYPCY